ncbi:MAG: glycoside hydrolase family 16 protein [Balneolaceae bacterium]|nr:glycoside hydrolase family 16 protein [Balneolaceae bacterium]
MKRFQFVLILLTTAIYISACGTDSGSDANEWELVWSDEFEGEAGESPNSDYWTYDIGRGNNGWGNQELQYYTDRPENVALDGEGNLVITALRESFQGAEFTSARIKTENLVEYAYGRFEARLKTPFGQGLWPAFWMLGSNFSEVGWPQSGEIDIMELRGQRPSEIGGALHGPGYSAGNAISQDYSLLTGRFDTEYHVFAVEWFEDRIDYYVDDVKYQTINRSDVPGEWVFDQPFFLILNVAVGGTYVGLPTDQTPFPQRMTVDYVRVYQLAD